MPPRKKTAARTAKPEPSKTNGEAEKRKAADDDEGEQAKRNDLRQTEISTESTDELEKPIIINRAPVLELWGASSISTITAISKGRSIGKVAPPDESKGDSSKKQGKKGDDFSAVKVMGFPITIKDDIFIVKGKPKTTWEVSLVRKYGSDESYGKVKEAMLEGLQVWKGKQDKLDEKAFHMYEKFRPDVAKGQKGWGRKGELHLSKVRDTIRQ